MKTVPNSSNFSFIQEESTKMAKWELEHLTLKMATNTGGNFKERIFSEKEP